MAQRRSHLLDGAVYLLVRTAVCVIQALSWDTALALSRTAARWLHRFDRRHRQIALDNVAQAFPELDESARADLVRRSYEHLTAMTVEMIKAPRTLTLANHKQYIYCSDEDNVRIDAVFQKSVPVLSVTGHFGNWEVFGYLIGLLGYEAGVIARRLDNPYLDRFLVRFREGSGLVVLDKSEDYEKILHTMATGGTLAVVGDQDAGRKGLFVNFFGRPASTYKSIALLSLQYGATIFVLGAARVGHPLKYRIYVEDVIEPAEYADDIDAPRKITERYTAGLERIIRRHPEQYFWVHRRWKSYVKYKLKKAA